MARLSLGGRIRLALGAILVVGACAMLVDVPVAAPDAHRAETSAGPVAVERIAGPFEHPWAVAFLPGGAMLVTERGGTLWHLEDGERRRVAGLPAVRPDGQGGLMDVVAARDFAETRTVFVTFAAPDGDATRTTLVSARLSEDGSRLGEVRTLFAQTPAVDSGRHFGSRVVEAADGTLFVTVGDRGDRPRAQEPDQTIGKVLRVARDGTVPADNPFPGEDGTRPEIWSLGHRNPQGAALDAGGRLWTVSHGARGGDEINRPEAGRNYGWPEISYGTHYWGGSFPGTRAEGMEQPVFYWDPSIAPSGMAILSGAQWPAWEGDIVVGALAGQALVRLDREGDAIAGEERLFEGVFGRIRDVREGPDGALWFLTDAADGALFRMVPAE